MNTDYGCEWMNNPFACSANSLDFSLRETVFNLTKAIFVP